MRNPLHIIHRHSIAEWLFAAEALYRLFLARLAVTFIPFKKIAPTIGKVTDAVENLPASVQAQQIGWAVRNVSKFTWWKSTCLVQAIAAQKMLAHRGIPGYLFFGVDKKEDTVVKLFAHAWVQAGNEIITGKQNHEKFTIVNIFHWS